jgi:putative ABC transport system permease protein
MRIKSKFRYAYMNQMRHKIFSLFMVLQLIAGFLCLYYGFNLYMDNKEKENIANNMLSKSIYRIESLYLPERDENNFNKNEDKSLKVMELFEGKNDSFISQAEVGKLFKYFDGADDIARYGRIQSIDGENYYDAGVIIANKFFFHYYGINVNKGRMLTNEELELKFDKPNTIKVLAGYDYEKYFNIGDKISNYDGEIKELEIVGFLPKDSFYNDFEGGKQVSLNKYIIAGYNISKNAEELLNYSILNTSYLLYDNNLNAYKINNINNDIMKDFHYIYGENIGLRNINNLNNYNKGILENRLEFTLKMIIIIMSFIFSTIIISSILLINKRKKEFAIHLISGGSFKDISEILFFEIYGLFILGMCIFSILILFMSQKVIISRLIIINILILIISSIVSLLPILIRKNQINDLLREE